MQETFNVLDSGLKIDESTLVEASAGTGKTFAIENIVARLIVEKEDFSIDSILVLTFTRAATKELKTRIYQRIQCLLESLEKEDNRDFLQSVDPNLAKKKLQQALFAFDEAQIFTIHSFCQKMLNEEKLLFGKWGVDRLILLRAIKDFFRVNFSREDYSWIQLEIILNHFKKDFDRLCEAVLNYLMQAPISDSGFSFSEDFHLFSKEWSLLKNKNLFNQKTLVDDYAAKAKSYKGLCDRSSNLKIDIQEKLLLFIDIWNREEFSRSDFEEILSLDLIALFAFSTFEKKKRLKDPELEIPLFTQLENFLYPIAKRALDFATIFSRVILDCGKIVYKLIEKEDVYFPDDLLKRMEKAIENQEFKSRIQERYQAAIVDEFQDTDAVQWYILHTLFLEKKLLYLVGDPKQSIYAFRGANLYIYFEAMNVYQKYRIMTLKTNYRSHPDLLSALNTLFTAAKDWLFLPKLKKTLDYTPVNAPQESFLKPLKDGKKAVHCFQIEGTFSKIGRWPNDRFENQVLFPTIVQEIQTLYQKEQLNFSSFAVLVKDRYQARRVAAFLREHHIPVNMQRSQTLKETGAIDLMFDLIDLLLNPYDIDRLKRVMGSSLIGLDEEMLAVFEKEYQEDAIDLFLRLKKTLLEEGFTSFFQLVMNAKIHGEKTILESLLERKLGEELYMDLIHITELLVEQESHFHTAPERYLTFLEEIKRLSIKQDEKSFVKREEGLFNVSIMTLFMSKGLEFDVVFPIGLLSNELRKEPFEKVDTQKGTFLTVADQNVLNSIQEEKEAESYRLLYVALTRAKRRLYLFDLHNTKGSFSSTMERFFEKIDRSVLDKNNHISRSYIKNQKESLNFQKESSTTILSEPVLPSLKRKKESILSFSSLSQGRKEKQKSTIKQLDGNVLNSFDLFPKGRETGVVIHQLLERFPFSSLTTREKIFHYLQKQELQHLEEYIEELTTLIKHLVHTPLDGFCLKDIDPKKSFSEMEFLYAENRGFIQGMVDYVFEFENTIYFIDWKTHLLDDYDQKNLVESVRENHYQMQADIYYTAIKRYFESFGKTPFKKYFGGVFYLYLRGLDGVSQNGVYHFFPQEFSLNEIKSSSSMTIY